MNGLRRVMTSASYYLQITVLVGVLSGFTNIVLPAPDASADTSSSVSSEDAYVVTSGASLNTNYGGATGLNISNAANRAFVKFSLTSIPSSAIITGVTLVVNQTQANITSGAINVRSASSAWSENTVTGATMPSYDTVNTLASTTVATSGTPLPVGDISIPLAASSVTPGNSSVSFAFDYSVGGIVAQIASRETGGTGPRLNLTYTLPPTIQRTIFAKEDAMLSNTDPTTNYANSNEMSISSANFRTLLKFNTSFIPTGSSVTSVKLRYYYTADVAAPASGNVRIHPYGAAWSESAVTYANQTWDSTVLTNGSVTPAAGVWDEVTLPLSVVSGSDVSFGLDYSISGKVAKIASHEDPQFAPQLVINYTPVQYTGVALTTTGDAYVLAENSQANTGSYSYMRVYNFIDGNHQSLIKFDETSIPVGSTVTSAKLRLNYPYGVASNVNVFKTNNAAWSESTVTSVTAPPTSGSSIATASPTSFGLFDTVLPTNTLNLGGEQTFKVTHPGGAEPLYLSTKESGSNLAPKLVLDYTVSSNTPPLVATTDNPTAISQNDAQFNATIDTNNTAASYYFEYYHTGGATPAYINRTPVYTLSAAVGPQTITKNQTYKFASGTTYQYRVVAFNDTGTWYGTYKQFVTPAATNRIIAIGGDMSCDPSSANYNSGLGSGNNCRQKATSDAIIADTTIEKVIALGDNQYECGSPGGFTESYGPSWGRFKSKTMPVPGNHEYATGSQVKSTYCRGQLTAVYAAGGTQITLNRGPGGTFPATGTFPIRLVKTTCADQTSSDNVGCYDDFTATVSSTNTWVVTRINDGTPALGFGVGADVLFMDGRSAAGYYDYFGNIASPRQPGCQDHCAGYYSWNIGNWHMIALNSNCSAADKFNANTSIGCTAGTPQYQWLVNDLKTVKPSQGILAYIHHPRLSSGDHGDHDGISNTTDLSDIWNLLRSKNGDIMLAGHDHDYERFRLMGYSVNKVIAPDVDGMRMWVVGNSGKNLISGTPDPKHNANRLAFTNQSYGVLKLTLRPTNYSWEFVKVGGNAFTDTGTTALYTN